MKDKNQDLSKFYHLVDELSECAKQISNGEWSVDISLNISPNEKFKLSRQGVQAKNSSMPMNLNPLGLLKEKICASFSGDDLKNLCFSLRLNDEDLNGENRSSKVNALIQHFCKQGDLEQLLEGCKFLRPHIDWPTMQELSTEN